MDAVHGGLEDAQSKKAGHPHQNGAQGAGRIGLAPVQAQQQGPEEGGFQTTKGKQVDPDQQVRRLQGCHKDNGADGGRTAQAEALDALQRHAAAVALQDVLYIQILDNGR